jgi:WD40 repeat protein
VVTASADQTIRIWDTRTGALLNTLRGQADEVFDIAYSPRGDLLASVGMNDGSIKLWDPTARAKPSSRRGADRPVGFGPDGLLWTWTEDGDLRRLDPDTLELRDVAIDFPGQGAREHRLPREPLCGRPSARALGPRPTVGWNSGTSRADCFSVLWRL